MIKGLGVDIVENNRFSSFPKGALEKIFTPFELSEMERRVDKTEFLASRFAVKEAVVKAYGTGFGAIGAKDIETRNDDKGKPFVLVNGERKDNIHVSLSHDEMEEKLGLAKRFREIQHGLDKIISEAHAIEEDSVRGATIREITQHTTEIVGIASHLND